MNAKTIITLLGIVFLSLLVTGPAVHAQEEASGDALSESEAGFVSFDFKDADIRNVLRIFSHKTGINIVASPDVQGSVTVKLNNVPWEKALKIILEMNEFAYVREGNVIKVLSKSKMAQEPLRTEVLALDYAKADEVKPTLEAMLTERGSIQTDGRANLLIVTDVPSQFDSMMKVVKRLDAPTPQVRIETKIIETTFDVTRNFGVNWSFLSGYSIGTDVFSKTWSRAVTDTWGKTLGNNDSTSLTESAIGLYNTDERGFTQAATDVTFDDDGNQIPSTQVSGYETRGDELHNFRQPTWLFSEGGFSRNETDSYARTFTGSRTKGNSESYTVAADGIAVVISALINDVGTDILSAPSIVTLDNKEAKIKVATDYPIPSFTYNEDTGDFAIDGFEYEPLGITMTVTPHVSPNGYVTLDLQPTISRNDGTVRFGGSLLADIPQIGKEEVITSVLVKDGDTIILGGLMRQFDDYQVDKFPIMHDIPVLGWLFKNHEKTVQKRNLLLFVTPTIIKKENVTTLTQDSADWYTKERESNEEPTTIYPNLELVA